MKKAIILALFLLHLVTSNNVSSQELTILENNLGNNSSIKKSIERKLYYPNGSIKEVGEIADQKLNGLWKYFYGNGQLKKEGNFVNNKFHGTWKSYDSEGNTILIENYINGIEDGIWQAFYTNGQLKTEGEFVEGKRQGNWKVYHDSGVLEKMVVFENDHEKSELIMDSKSSNPTLFSIGQSISNY